MITKISGESRLNENSGCSLVCDVVNGSSFSQEGVLVDLALLCRDIGIELDFSERAFILANVLLEDRQQRLGLLRAQVDALKVLHLNFLRRHRLQAAKNQQKVPHAHADLD